MKKSLLLSTLILTASIALLGSDLARAEDAAKKPDHAAKKFEKRDSDKNGSLSLDEFKSGAKDPAKAEKAFKNKDANNDGGITLEEFSAKKEKSNKKKQ